MREPEIIQDVSPEVLAARYIQLIAMTPSQFSGHECELADVNETLWQRFGFKAADNYIAQARNAYELLAGASPC